jgi:hypothetical protein
MKRVTKRERDVFPGQQGAVRWSTAEVQAGEGFDAWPGVISDGGSRYMSQPFIDETGRVVSVRRKLKPTHVERSQVRGRPGRPLLAPGRLPAPFQP